MSEQHPQDPSDGRPAPDPGRPHALPPTAAGQPYPGQPYPGQPHPGQPSPGQPYPGQPYAGQPYPGQPYPVGPGQYYPPPPPSTDLLAVLGLVFAFVFWPAGLVLSILGLSRTKATGDRTGHGLALAGAICSGAFGLITILYLAIWVLAAGTFLGVLVPVISNLPSATPMP